MRIRIAVPDAHVGPEVLNAALETTTRANEAMLASGDAEPISDAIRHGAVKWKPEPFRDGEHFDLADEVHRRGWGDCDDLAPALAAELRHKGADDGARAVVRKSGHKRWHAVTELSDGRIVDPSEMAGMYEYKKRHGDSFVNGPGEYGLVGSSVIRPMCSSDVCVVGIKPYRDGWAARVDLPVDLEGMSDIVGLAHHSDPLEAMGRAVNTACIVGAASGLVTPEDIARTMCVHACFQGQHPHDVAQALAEHLSGAEVGSLFGSVFKGLKGLAAPALSMAKFLPIPGASLAAQAAEGLLKGGGGGGGGAPAAMPQAPGLAAMMHEPAQVHQPSGSHGPIIIKF